MKLRPRYEDGIIVVGGRTERWLDATLNKQSFVLLPKDNRISQLIIEYEHAKGGHLGISSIISQIRSKYWILHVRKTFKALLERCLTFKIKYKRLASQIMSSLPIERIKPSPPFYNVRVDYFGPFFI